MADRLKVVHLITDLDTGGAEMMLYKLLTRMDRERFVSSVISLTDRGSLGSRLEASGVPVFTLGMRRGLPNPLGAWRLVNLLREERPHVLQTWLYHADLLGLVAGKLAHIPAISWNIRCSDMDMRHYSWLSWLVLRSLAKLSPYPDVIVVNSESGRRLHESLGYTPRQWKLIPNGFDLEQFQPDPAARMSLRQELGLSPDALLIGLVARYDPMKDQQTFLEAAGQIACLHRDVRFVLVGRGVSDENGALSALIQGLELAGRVYLLGERSDIPRIMAALDILSLASVFGEGFPNVVGEAMACEIPCVVTDIGDSAHIIGDNGIVVPPRAPAAMAAAWGELLAMPAERRRALGRSARERIRQHFSLESVTRQYEVLYAEMGKVRRNR